MKVWHKVATLGARCCRTIKMLFGQCFGTGRRQSVSYIEKKCEDAFPADIKISPRQLEEAIPSSPKESKHNPPQEKEKPVFAIDLSEDTTPAYSLRNPNPPPFPLDTEPFPPYIDPPFRFPLHNDPPPPPPSTAPPNRPLPPLPPTYAIYEPPQVAHPPFPCDAIDLALQDSKAGSGVDGYSTGYKPLVRIDAEQEQEQYLKAIKYGDQLKRGLDMLAQFREDWVEDIRANGEGGGK
ncbi:hypothetical protein P154DRAFT_558544, partial [Amniculicola lignicola CBS 123094]